MSSNRHSRIHRTAASKKKARRGRREAQPCESRKALSAAGACSAMQTFFSRHAKTWVDGEPGADETNMLSPPAVAAKLHTLEKSIGRPLPPSLRASLMVHKGESNEPVGLLYDYQLLQTPQILDEWNTMRNVPARWSDEENTPLDAVEGIL